MGFEAHCVEPDQRGFDAGGALRRVGDFGDDVAAADVEFVFEGEGDGLRCGG